MFEVDKMCYNLEQFKEVISLFRYPYNCRDGRHRYACLPVVPPHRSGSSPNPGTMPVSGNLHSFLPQPYTHQPLLHYATHLIDRRLQVCSTCHHVHRPAALDARVSTMLTTQHNNDLVICKDSPDYLYNYNN